MHECDARARRTIGHRARLSVVTGGRSRRRAASGGGLQARAHLHGNAPAQGVGDRALAVGALGDLGEHRLVEARDRGRSRPGCSPVISYSCSSPLRSSSQASRGPRGARRACRCASAPGRAPSRSSRRPPRPAAPPGSSCPPRRPTAPPSRRAGGARAPAATSVPSPPPSVPVHVTVASRRASAMRARFPGSGERTRKLARAVACPPPGRGSTAAMPAPQCWFAASTEEFAPSQMLEQAQAAERAGFDGLATSDHFAPWFPDGAARRPGSSSAAAGQDTKGPMGTSVTPIVHHYHPGVVAQAFMSLEELYPGRVFLGAGSGEALNEVPLGLDWPPVGEQIERLEQGLEAITRLWDGETVTMDAGWFRLQGGEALHARARAPAALRLGLRPAGGEGRRALRRRAVDAGRPGDRAGDHRRLPRVLRAARPRARRDHPPGGLPPRPRTRRGRSRRAQRWKPTQMPEVYKRGHPRPGRDGAAGAGGGLRRGVRQGGVPGRRRPGRARRAPARAAGARARRSCACSSSAADPWAGRRPSSATAARSCRRCAARRGRAAAPRLGLGLAGELRLGHGGLRAARAGAAARAPAAPGAARSRRRSVRALAGV